MIFLVGIVNGSVGNYNTAMGLEKLAEVAERARSAGVPGILVDKALKVAALELKENLDCPVPVCLTVLLEKMSEDSGNRLAMLELDQILYIREQRFKHPGEEPVFYPY